MKRARLLRDVAVLAGALTLAACSDDATPSNGLSAGPEPGTLAVAMTSPAPDDGGVTFTLSGPGITNVRAAHEGLQIFPRAEAGGWTVAVLGGGLSGELVRFDVPDVAASAGYEVALLEVADEANELRRDLNGHRLEVMRAH